MPVDLRRYARNWPALRDEALVDAEWRCQGCGVTDLEDGSNATRLTVHHPDRDPENTQPRLTVLCAGCHLAVEPRARRREAVLAASPGMVPAEAWAMYHRQEIEGQVALEIPE